MVAQINPYANTSATSALGDSSTHAVVVVPSDTVDLPIVAGALYIGGAGDVTVDTLGGETNVTLKAVPLGRLRLAVTRVYATGTTATNIVALH